MIEVDQGFTASKARDQSPDSAKLNEFLVILQFWTK